MTGYTCIMLIKCHYERLRCMNNTIKKLTLLNEMRTKMRREGYAYSTENSYCDWVRRFVKFHAFKIREAMLIDSSSSHGSVGGE